MAHNHTTLHKVSHAEKEKTRLRTTLKRNPGSGVSAGQMVSTSATGLTLIRRMPSVPTELPAASVWNSSQQPKVWSIRPWPHWRSPPVGWNNDALRGLASVRSPSFRWCLSMDIIEQIYYLKQHLHRPILGVSKQLTVAAHTGHLTPFWIIVVFS